MGSEQSRDQGEPLLQWHHLCAFEGDYASETRPGHSASSPFSLAEDLWENSV